MHSWRQYEGKTHKPQAEPQQKRNFSSPAPINAVSPSRLYRPHPLEPDVRKQDQDQDNTSELLFAELSEEMRQDQVIQFLKKYQYFIMAGILAFVTAFGGLLAYDGYQTSQRKALATDIAQAQALLNEGDAQAGLSLLQEVAQRSDFYGYQAAMILAKRSLAEGAFDQAATQFSALAQTTGLKAPYKELAEIYALLAASNTGLSDSQTASLKALADGKGAYAGMAKELQVALMVQQGQVAEALAAIDLLLADDGSSASLKFRMEQLKTALDKG